jgi:hypothetical protein
MIVELLSSKTIWGIVAMIAALVAKNFGFELDAEGLTTDLLAAAGAGLAIYGRVKAGGPIENK